VNAFALQLVNSSLVIPKNSQFSETIPYFTDHNSSDKVEKQ
jgi:hypothetical protein